MEVEENFVCLVGKLASKLALSVFLCLLMLTLGQPPDSCFSRWDQVLSKRTKVSFTLSYCHSFHPRQQCFVEGMATR